MKKRNLPARFSGASLAKLAPGSSQSLCLPSGHANTGALASEDVVPGDEGIRVCDVLPVNRTMKKYKICVTIILNFLLVIF